MNKYEELASEIIDVVCEAVEKLYEIEPQDIDDAGLENPALINGTAYYDLESRIAETLRLSRSEKGTTAEEQEWQIWVLSEGDIDLVAEEMHLTLKAKEKEEVARLFKKGFEHANVDWDFGLRDAILEVRQRADVLSSLGTAKWGGMNGK